MSNTPFYVPKLLEKGVWRDDRGTFAGGYGWRHNIALSGIKYVITHHSVTTPTKNALKDIQTLFNIHVGGNGWGGIGYNFVITSEEKNGFAKVSYVGDLANARAHAPNTRGAYGIAAGYGNNHLIGVCFIGSFHTGKLPTVAQLRSAHYLFEELIFKENARLPGLADTWGSNKGHQEMDQTACPSNQLTKLKQLIKDTKEAAPVITKPYKLTAIPKKEIQLIRDAGLYDLNFKTWATAKTIRTLKKGEVLSVTQIADHDLGSRYYVFGTGGVNKVDVKDYVKPAPAPTTPPLITEPEPVKPEDRPADATQDHQNSDMIGVKDSLSRIEAIVTQILATLKSIFKL